MAHGLDENYSSHSRPVFLLESLVDEGQPTGDRKKKHLGHIVRVFSKPYMVYYGHAQYNLLNSSFCSVISTEIYIADGVYSFFHQVLVQK